MHVLMTGPLRPSIDYVIWFCNDVRQRIPGCKVYILYWETTEEDQKRLEEVFDRVFAVPEPTSELKFAVKMKQAPIWDNSNNTYKLYYAVRMLIDKLTILDSTIVMRIRTDAYIEKIGFPQPGPNQFLFCPKLSCGTACDWFGIGSIGTLKKLYYMHDIEYTSRAKNAWNSEHIILNNAKIHGIEMVSINSTTRLALAREYPPMKLQYYD